MFNFHSGTGTSSLTLALSNFMVVFMFHDVSHKIVVIGLLVLTSFSLFILIATLTRFFINLKKCAPAFYENERMPY